MEHHMLLLNTPIAQQVDIVLVKKAFLNSSDDDGRN